ncbi:hypothetical protein [Streptomyces sp. AK02-01A]|uniref:hypothetical protein n=1 Tax=Streptomyces sp. AK02-01A TaxID=3028648 RepID=UPI0029BF0AED|nr:hypothetical protein [Streptomyces sp. AK02-01A]MDX3852319.1 hypothetical protein [Streptomyces sp. AK02-01A]
MRVNKVFMNLAVAATIVASVAVGTQSAYAGQSAQGDVPNPPAPAATVVPAPTPSTDNDPWD